MNTSIRILSHITAPAILILCSLSLQLKGQEINPLPFIAGAQNDINYLAGEYLRPVGTAMNNGLNNSWYSTADVHPLGGFHINIAPSLVIVPAEAQSFKIENSKLEELELADPQDNIAPTAFGKDEEGPMLRSKSLGSNQTFNTPPGVGFSFLPIANINLGAGIGFNTEVDLRFFPKSKIAGLDDARIGLFGFGVTHEVSAWFYNEKPPVHISAMVAYSNLSYEQPIEVNTGGDGHQLEMKSKGLTIRAIVSKEFSFLTLYGGAGFNNATANMDLKGSYTYEASDGSTATIEDPVSVSSDSSGLLANLGARVKILKAVVIFADYTFAEYSSVTAGLGVDLNFK